MVNTLAGFNPANYGVYNDAGLDTPGVYIEPTRLAKLLAFRRTLTSYSRWGELVADYFEECWEFRGN